MEVVVAVAWRGVNRLVRQDIRRRAMVRPTAGGLAHAPARSTLTRSL
jgi:hypothetical protein